MEQALYGPAGFFTRDGARGPVGHFRTSSTASPLFAQALADLLVRVDTELDHPKSLDLVEIGAGRGELLTGVLASVPAELAGRLNPIAVELAPRPADLSDRIGWSNRPPETITGLLLAIEWLDNVPVDIASLDDPLDADPLDDTSRDEDARDGVAGLGGVAAVEPRYVMVDSTGAERSGRVVEPADAAWLARWWPLPEAGFRAEIGAPRDVAWATAVSRVTRGLALAVDYGHLRAERPPFGSLTGFRDGRQVEPVPDGTCDLTTHVAMDAVAAAGGAAAGVPPMLLSQRAALHALGVSGGRPPRSLATTDPTAYQRQLASASAAAELTDTAGLGGHTWLAQPVGISQPFA
jgi:SAM-dependent MidA family methyltransferase